MSDFMKLDEAVEIVMELATDNVLDDSIIANDPHLSDEQARQETAIATVEDFFVNNVFEGVECEAMDSIELQDQKQQILKFSPPEENEDE